MDKRVDAAMTNEAHTSADDVTHLGLNFIVDDIVFPDGRTAMGILGGGGTQAAWGMAAALGDGVHVGLIGAIGDDLDHALLAPLHRARINLAGLAVTSPHTPRAWQVMEYDGRRTNIWRTERFQEHNQQARLHNPYRYVQVVHVAVHPDAAELDLALMRDLRTNGCRVSIEPATGVRQPLTDDALHDLICDCEVFSPNWVELCSIMGSNDLTRIRHRLRALGGRLLVIRRGEQGADAWPLDQAHGIHVDPVPTTIIDTVGAGNCFCGAFITRLHEGVETALACASAAASYTLEQVGVPSRLPDTYDQRVAMARASLRSM
jgi:cytidine kinase